MFLTRLKKRDIVFIITQVSKCVDITSESGELGSGRATAVRQHTIHAGLILWDRSAKTKLIPKF